MRRATDVVEEEGSKQSHAEIISGGNGRVILASITLRKHDILQVGTTDATAYDLQCPQTPAHNGYSL